MYGTLYGSVYTRVPRYLSRGSAIHHTKTMRPDESCGTIQHAPRHGRSIEWKPAVKLYGVMHTTQPGWVKKSVVYSFIEISQTMGA